MRLFKRYVVKDYVVICLVEFEHIVVEQQRVAFDNVFSVHDIIEDAVFFYPIIGAIRDNLIENLKDE